MVEIQEKGRERGRGRKAARNPAPGQEKKTSQSLGQHRKTKDAGPRGRDKRLEREDSGGRRRKPQSVESTEIHGSRKNLGTGRTWNEKPGREPGHTVSEEERESRKGRQRNRASARERREGQAAKLPGAARPSQNAEAGKGKRKVQSLCSVSGRCGGCQLLDVPYDKQLAAKEKQVTELLKGFCRVYPITGMEDPFHYRNKVHAAFGYRKGEAVSGIYKEGTHEIVPIDSCMLEDKEADQIITTVRGMLKSFKLRTYDEDTGYGFLRHVLVKRGFATGQIMVVLVTASPVFPSKNHFVKALLEKHPQITTIIQNLNDRHTSMVLGDREHVLYGKGYIEDELCRRVFRISSKSFYQVNPVQTEKLYKKAMEAAALTGKETVIDAYCGIGTIGIVAAEKAGRVIGVEMNQDAVRDAVQNARRNKITNIQFYNNDAGQFMAGMADAGERADVVFMDPPRCGSTEEFIEAVSVLRPRRVVYVSCNPETLARDLKVFKKNGYKAERAWPFDMFPHTEHVETVVLLSKRKPDDIY